MSCPKFQYNKLDMKIQISGTCISLVYIFYLRIFGLIIIHIVFEIKRLIYEICLIKDNFPSMIKR